MGIKKFCSKQGCPNLVDKGERFCSKHSSVKVYCGYSGCSEMVSAIEKFCNKHQPKRLHDLKRENANNRGYNSLWARISKHYLMNNPVCERCGKSPSVLVHHIKPIKLGGSVYDGDNLMGLCASCHAIIHAEISSRQYSK